MTGYLVIQKNRIYYIDAIISDVTNILKYHSAGFLVFSGSIETYLSRQYYFPFFKERATLSYILFSYHLKLGHNEDAYAAMMSNPDASRR